MAVFIHRSDSPHAEKPDAAVPWYRSHKAVKAIKIGILHEVDDDGICVFSPEDPSMGIQRVVTEPGWSERFKGDAEDMGYWVQYTGGYESWSPTKAFEGGYTKIEEVWS